MIIASPLVTGLSPKISKSDISFFSFLQTDIRLILVFADLRQIKIIFLFFLLDWHQIFFIETDILSFVFSFDLFLSCFVCDNALCPINNDSIMLGLPFKAQLNNEEFIFWGGGTHKY